LMGFGGWKELIKTFRMSLCRPDSARTIFGRE
jgi:hypothetical protein